MIQKLQTFTNFNNMNKFLPKARTALLSTVAALGLGAMTSCSSCSKDNTNCNKIENVAPENYEEYLTLVKDSINTEEAIKDIEKQISTEQYDTSYYNMLDVNPKLANAKTTLREALKIKHDILLQQYAKIINRIKDIKVTD